MKALTVKTLTSKMKTNSTQNEQAKASFSCRRSRIAGIRSMLLNRIPEPLTQRLKFAVRLSLDGMDTLLGRRKELVPPRRLNFGGDGNFEKTGDEFLEYFVQLGQLRSEHRVLEMGCGIGRMARPLTKYLVSGSYEGIDIVPRGIRWCQEHFTGRYPNFHFQMADVQNREYNPGGRFRPTEYRFPFEDGEFDFVYLTSVFTHMLKNDMTHYLRETSRVLRPGGKCLITFFLLNEQSRKLISSGLSSLDFRFPQDGCWTADEKLPENALAYEEEYIRGVFSESSLLLENLQFGAWCGRNEYLSYQDVLIAQRV
jgi:SAM-dependent methyltransferase